LRKLSELSKGEKGKIKSVGREAEGSYLDSLSKRLLEMGMCVGSEVEVVLEAPFGRDPIAVRVRGAVIALRREEASLVELEESGGQLG